MIKSPPFINQANAHAGLSGFAKTLHATERLTTKEFWMDLMLKTLKNFAALVFAATIGLSVMSAPAQANDMKKWQIEVVKSVAKNQRYPRSAIAREIEGKAKVRLVVAADGSITSHEIVEATGEEVLDNEIPKLVEKLNPLPALPGGQAEMSFVLPLSWTLN